MTAPPVRLRAARATAFALVLAVLLAVIPAGLLAARAQAATTPSEWDPRIKPIADKVAELRKLQFEHPVAVRFLSDAEFEKRQRSDRSKLSKDDERELKRTQSQLRALGLLSQDVDLFDASNDIRSSDVLAYYNPADKKITVKGKGDLDVATRVTVAHELTHALQDQHFDLQKIQRVGSQHHAESATRALVEGDAVRVEGLYRDQLSAADKQAAVDGAQAQADAAQADAQANQTPSMLLALFEAPYAFGPALVQTAAKEVDGGIDGLFRHPPTSDAAFLTPSTLVDDTQPKTVAQPKTSNGEKRVGKPDVFGAYALYLVLASHLGPQEALRVADLWGGDSMITLERDGRTCVRAAFVGRSGHDTATIATALDQWAATQPTGAATVDRTGGPVTLTACDTGVAATPIAHQGDEVVTYAAGRDTIYAGLVDQGTRSAPALCTANGVVQDPTFAPLLAHPDQEPPADQVTALRARVVSIAADCARTSGS